MMQHKQSPNAYNCLYHHFNSLQIFVELGSECLPVNLMLSTSAVREKCINMKMGCKHLGFTLGCADPRIYRDSRVLI